MKRETSMYKLVIRDYFLEFVRGFRREKLEILVYCSIGLSCTFGFWGGGSRRNWLVGLPVLFSLVSAGFHEVSLPFMMYLVPFSRRQREDYIQKMLMVKIAAPAVFGLLCDAAAWLCESVTVYAFVLQMLSIFSITFLCGMLKDGRVDIVEKKPAYGGIKEFVGIPLSICYIGGTAMSLICMDSIGRVEFWVVWCVASLILLPMMYVVGKRWKRIRSDFADLYQLSVPWSGMKGSV